MRQALPSMSDAFSLREKCLKNIGAMLYGADDEPTLVWRIGLKNHSPFRCILSLLFVCPQRFFCQLL